MMKSLFVSVLLAPTAGAFAPTAPRSATSNTQLHSSVSNLDELKASLVAKCTATPKTSLMVIRDAVDEVEALAEQLGIGQASSSSGLLSGEWELLYSPDDVTRSSPFFWAFAQAFPDNADQIYSITDSIPAPIKETGPAYQTINFVPESGTGQFVSKVKVATLGGLATSIMTTRAAITRAEGLDGIRLVIETTKPEESTVLQALGPFGSLINDNAPAFPSGEALEQVKPGSSEVVLRTTFCDDGLRVSRNNQAYDDVYVWKRRAFSSFEML